MQRKGSVWSFAHANSIKVLTASFSATGADSRLAAFLTQVVEAVLVQASRTSAVYVGAEPYEEAEEEQARISTVHALLQQQQQQQQQQQEQPPQNVHPMLLLDMLLPHSVASSPGVQYLLTEKLILGQQRCAMIVVNDISLCMFLVHNDQSAVPADREADFGPATVRYG